jgi:hypothetical protein
MHKTAARINNWDAAAALGLLNDEVLERWRMAMASSDQVLVGQLVQTSHDIRDARRNLLPMVLPLKPESPTQRPMHLEVTGRKK